MATQVKNKFQRPQASDMIGTGIAAKMLGFTKRHIQTMCSLGQFKTVKRLGYGTRGHYTISRLEVICKLHGGELQEQPLTLKH